MDVDTRLLRAFVVVAEERHVTRAAERLLLAQPALSKQLRRLEDQLGAPLVIRNSHGVDLTAAGNALLPAARDTLRDWDAAQRRVRTAARAGLPQLIVGFITDAAHESTPEITRRFTERRRHWRVELMQSDWGDPTAGLASGITDAALIRLGRPAVIGAVVGTPDERLHAILNGLGIGFAFASAARYYAPPGITYRPIAGLSPSTVAVAHRRDTGNPAIDDFVISRVQAVSTATHELSR